MGNTASTDDERILQYLSRHVTHLVHEDQEGLDSDEDTVSGELTSTRQDPSNLVDLAHRIYLQTGVKVGAPQTNVNTALRERELMAHWRPSNKMNISQRLLPESGTGEVVKEYRRRGFCGQYSSDGSLFMSASESRSIRLYDTRSWKQMKEVVAGLEIRDIDYSPDQRFLIYSGWSPNVFLCNVVGEHEVHDSLTLSAGNPGGYGGICFFSVKFSPTSDHIIGGTNDNSLYLYDLNRRELETRVEAHSDDVNAVCYLTKDDSNMILTGSDDCLVKLWDRRTLGKARNPDAIFCGHGGGITYISSRSDGRYFISNGKDSCTKLFDIRSPAPSNSSSRYQLESNRGYSMGGFGSGRPSHDCSLATYGPHRVSTTLIRCYFSPERTTGQRYIISGSADGNIYIYDILTTKVVKKLQGHQGLVRDISWHPCDMTIVSTSWDSTHGLWSYANSPRAFYPSSYHNTSSTRNSWW